MALSPSLSCSNTSISADELASGILVKDANGVVGYRTVINYIAEEDLTALVSCDHNPLLTVGEGFALALGVNTAGDRALILHVTEVIGTP